MFNKLDGKEDLALKIAMTRVSGATVSGEITVRTMWGRIAVAAHKGLAAGNDNAFYEAKLNTARFYIARVLPQTTSLNHQIKAGAATLMALPAEAF